ncbi:ABC transporter permease [Inmirania thermothiophila]|uniref:Putative ABC transport system permease protein n=1 Tax=Inmirania thermothiophila TaxID=1750597 RepID=A0A3N1Y6M9_9GAMM|nr:iron export ABC transporter permease subunit FetB [Inmirania thermothiophila]ROR34410.1 putative ABC transport system permease protein [Inmirania thermothiophila]
MIPLSPLDLALAAALVLALAGLSAALGLGIGRGLLTAAARAALQLALVGLVLKALFAARHPALVAAVAAFMLAVAGREVLARQQVRLRGGWGLAASTLPIALSTFAVTVLALAVIIAPEPWYAPRYAVPLLGMLLGNAMNGVAIGLDRLHQGIRREAAVIEQRLALGEPWAEAVGGLRRESVRAGMIPIINAMAAAGVVSLPGMMTGQILAGAPPLEAVRYQLLILLLIAAASGLGTLGAVWIATRRLTDGRERLRLDRLTGPAP